MYDKEKDSSYFREAGWEQLSGKWPSAVIFTFIYFIISMIVAALQSFVGLLVLFITPPLYYSYNVAFLDNKRTGEEVKVDTLFDGFKDYVRVTLTLLLEYVYVFLWSWLLIIPGIIKSIEYSQTCYVLKDNPGLAYNAAIERSMAMMRGHRMELFILYLTFIGWWLLVIFTFGIAALWVQPYVSASLAHFYEYVKEDYEKRIAAL